MALCNRAREIETRRFEFEIANQQRINTRPEKMDALMLRALDVPIVGSSLSTSWRNEDGTLVYTKTSIQGLDLAGYAGLQSQMLKYMTIGSLGYGLIR